MSERITTAEAVALMAAGMYATPPTEAQMNAGCERAEAWLAAHDAEVEARVRGEVAEVTNEMVEAAREPHVGDPASMWEVSEDDERCNESSAILFCARPVGHDGLHAARWDAKVQGVWR